MGAGSHVHSGTWFYFVPVSWTGYPRIKIFIQKERMTAKSSTTFRHPFRGKLQFDTPFHRKGQDLIRLHLNNYSIFTYNNRIQVLKSGQEKFAALLKALQSARHHIPWNTILYEMTRLAGRFGYPGVQSPGRSGGQTAVWWYGLPGSAQKICPAHHWSRWRSRSILPSILPHINIRVNYRNHRKITIIDGKTAFIGGLNLGDEYLGKSPKYGFWRDTHFMVEGNAVDFLQLRFLTDWEFAAKASLPFDENYFPVKKTTGEKGIQIVSSPGFRGMPFIRVL